MKNKELDSIDLKILNILQNDARISIKELAAQVYLSSPAVSARIEQLEKAQYIKKYQAVIDPIKMGFHIKAFVNLKVEPIQKKDFYPYIEQCPNVIECNCVTGDYSMLLEVRFPSTHELDAFIGDLQQFGQTKTLIVFSTSVEHRGIGLAVEDKTS
ncbi:MAG: Lrp/AsnC family transcriptional regulator, leucine-responsive regulatory protein [Eubacteriaceae bacterium]|jgi:Lrp/AsnC family leucine-responsive transcriptional regulator|nr:Lrp/AsnC family transcriptional regulator, leucine-responsive regulatory protein [Eubacteriaceae bacterium]MDK2904115.1 Lrp/AsnC family transcriptional regulator, leucine-responsive regulatory protein [Eubacteriaceae bacterium]MDK2935065.1 Lrp/AsnC family transcriptional regulator, leucine-responsive regulatory protein [Eubacteriaceae bacterium]MDK2961437.1 Lrp/AsnC family transcriptional regulator, leucine-responsive regulatory protein [Eubacteriaceae bacterium]MDN5306804.1 Lrp/AsnC family 